MKGVHHKLQEVAGRKVAHFAERAGKPAQSTLLLLLCLPSEDGAHASF
jgi:hypothetical protein